MSIIYTINHVNFYFFLIYNILQDFEYFNSMGCFETNLTEVDFNMLYSRDTTIRVHIHVET